MSVLALRHRRDADLYVFGSVLSGKATASSDIDVLIVADVTDDEKARLKADVMRKMGFSPAKIHVVSEKEFKKWYLRFINEIERI
ncbi:MAG: nucleotidyltransferase domain-containing protein [Candidatus Methanodesulfokora sp.]